MRTDPSPGGQPSLADFFYHCDDLFSVTALTDEDGDPVEFYDYGEHGGPFVRNAAGSNIGTSAYNNPYMFTGRRFDLESRFYYYRTRYYAPTIGRFTTRDTIGIWGDEDNLGNASNYVASNPWLWMDPFGEAHRKGKRKSTRDKHEKGTARQKSDQGGEKGDKRRKDRSNKRKRPKNGGRAHGKTLGILAVGTCVAAAGKALDNCLERARERYEGELRKARNFKCREDQKEWERLSDREHTIDVVDCNARYLANAAGCTLGLGIF